MYEIVIIMFMALGTPSYVNDAVKISHKNGEVLEFATHEKCLKHLWENLDDLKAFARTQFEGSPPVKEILCAEKGN